MSNSKQKSKNWFKDNIHWIGFIVIGILILVIVFIIICYLPIWIQSYYNNYLPNYSILESSLTAIGIFISGLALIGLMITILLQSHQIKLQRKDIDASIREQKAQAEALEKQVKIASITAQLNTLPNLINNIIVFLAGSSVSEKDRLLYGDLCLIEIEIENKNTTINFVHALLENSNFPKNLRQTILKLDRWLQTSSDANDFLKKEVLERDKLIELYKFRTMQNNLFMELANIGMEKGTVNTQ